MTSITDLIRLPGRKGEQNNMWKGGRSIASNGYVLIRVGLSHPLSDTRGYAYEHRLVASQKIGRSITSSEHVHHINGDKTDNRPENLEVLTVVEHRLVHRKKDSNRKLPTESNEFIECLCGCGERFLKFDESGRPRDYISGHNTQRIDIDLLFDFMGSRSVTVKEISEALGFSVSTVNKLMLDLRKEQKITKFKRSQYCQTKYADIYLSNPLIDCRCGCGEQFAKFDKGGRIRKYISGHNFRK